ncbi:MULTISPECIES: hypothetical protein [unclassified Polaromonas]|uniref:hypothetical protein n=1 Tax=unclassified Polaromonas TaxID=2638319 RepID=UPI000BBC164F|nr:MULTISPECIES: hypothetical protein [unclassified Polaromonas]MDP1566835.1 hypothetical protein [Polaromonas sp.]
MMYVLAFLIVMGLGFFLRPSNGSPDAGGPVDVLDGDSETPGQDVSLAYQDDFMFDQNSSAGDQEND